LIDLIEYSKSEYPLIREATFKSLTNLLSINFRESLIPQTEKKIFYEILRKIDYLVPLILISLEDESHFVKRCASNFLCLMIKSGKEGNNYILKEKQINGENNLFLIFFFIINFCYF
jgi:hypothetical protein